MPRLLYHPATTDIAMEVLKRFYVKEKDGWKLKVLWWNVGLKHPPYCMNITQKVQLTSSQYAQWKPKGVSRAHQNT